MNQACSIKKICMLKLLKKKQKKPKWIQMLWNSDFFQYLHNLLYLWGSHSKCKPETELNQIDLLLQLYYSTGRWKSAASTWCRDLSVLTLHLHGGPTHLARFRWWLSKHTCRLFQASCCTWWRSISRKWGGETLTYVAGERRRNNMLHFHMVLYPLVSVVDEV